MNDRATQESRGLLVIVSGPSGAGKTTIARAIESQLGGVFSVSMTTRPRSGKDVEGVDYYFVSKQQFEAARDAGQLLEWAQVFDNYYGTPREPVERSMDRGRLIILEIDVQGAHQVKQKLPGAFALFVLPPDEATLLQRLRQRGRDAEEVIQRRFAKAKQEIARARELQIYDAFVVNDQLDRAVNEAISLVQQRLVQQRATTP